MLTVTKPTNRDQKSIAENFIQSNINTGCICSFNICKTYLHLKNKVWIFIFIFFLIMGIKPSGTLPLDNISSPLYIFEAGSQICPGWTYIWDPPTSVSVVTGVYHLLPCPALLSQGRNWVKHKSFPLCPLLSDFLSNFGVFHNQ